MNLRVVAALIVSVTCARLSDAAFTPISDAPDQQNEPNLVGVNPYPDNPNPSILETVYGEANLQRVDDMFDHAFRHTGDTATVKAIARFNNPSIEETLRYYRADGTSSLILRFERVPPNFFFPVGYDPLTAINNPIQLADSGQIFEIGLGSLTRSNPARNTGGQDKMVTFEIVGNDGHPENTIGNYVVGWEYFNFDDLDYQDLVVEISGVVAVPEPALATLLVASALMGCPGRWHRRR